MTTVKTHKTKYGRVVRGTIELTIEADLPDGDDREQIPEAEAQGLLEKQLDEIAGSNDGSELLANADVEIPENSRIHDGPVEGGIFSSR